jgi:hypothetical protein
MSRKPISLRFEESLLRQLDEYAESHGTTRTTLLEEMGSALVEGRLAVLPRVVGERTILPQQPSAGSSPVFPALVCMEDTDE